MPEYIPSCPGDIMVTMEKELESVGETYYSHLHHEYKRDEEYRWTVKRSIVNDDGSLLETISCTGIRSFVRACSRFVGLGDMRIVQWKYLVLPDED